jgi:signal transduction histidine kinase
MQASRTAHEINNLLAKILGAAELALDFATNPAVRRELDLIASLAEEGARMVHQLEGASGPRAR